MIVGDVHEMLYCEVNQACDLVRENWGDEAADRAHGQMVEYFKGGAYAPKFFASSIMGGTFPKIAGFAAYCPSMRMKDAYDLIWIAIAKDAQGHGLGKLLTDYRLEQIKMRGGQTVELMTQKPAFFKKFGFSVALEMDSWHLMLLQLETVRI